jgi:Lon protease-like protein
MREEDRMPLFPLGLVLLPGMPLPLHIFEERYKLMIAECLDQHKVFGIVYVEAQGMRKVGCSARILEVLKRYEDGQMDIMTVGEQRFVIRDLHESKAYMEADVVFFDDEPEAQAGETEAVAREGVALLIQLNSILGHEMDAKTIQDLDVQSLSFLIASQEGFTPDEKQSFLQMTSVGERLEKGVKSLKRLIKRVGLTLEIKKIIGGNGNVPHHMVSRKEPGPQEH